MDDQAGSEFVILPGAMCMVPVAAEKPVRRSAWVHAAISPRDVILKEFRSRSASGNDERFGGVVDGARAEGGARERFEPASRSNLPEGVPSRNGGLGRASQVQEAAPSTPAGGKVERGRADGSEVLNSRRPVADMWLLLDVLLSTEEGEAVTG